VPNSRASHRLEILHRTHSRRRAQYSRCHSHRRSRCRRARFTYTASSGRSGSPGQAHCSGSRSASSRSRCSSPMHGLDGGSGARCATTQPSGAGRERRDEPTAHAAAAKMALHSATAFSRALVSRFRCAAHARADCLRAEWMNTLLSALWSVLDEALFESMGGTLEDVMTSVPPAFLHESPADPATQCLYSLYHPRRQGR